MVAERIRQVAGWREILLGDDEAAKRRLIDSLEGNDLVVALSALDELSEHELDTLARYRTDSRSRRAHGGSAGRAHAAREEASAL